MNRRLRTVFFMLISSGIIACSSTKNTVIATENPANQLTAILKKYPLYFDSIIIKKDELNVQIIYTQIDRKQNGKASFTDYYFNVNDSNYFYPASTVKFPVAALALQRLNELKIPGLDKNTTIITEAEGNGQTIVYNDPSSRDGRPTIAQYIKKILLVSDNNAFNRLYEFLGQEYINTSLHKMGYRDAQIIHRLDVSLSEEQNRVSNPIRFYDTTGKVIYEKPAERSRLLYAQRNTKLGRGYMSGNTLINAPFDFSAKNRLSLTDLQGILQSIMFPHDVAVNRRFNLTKSDYAFLWKYMFMFPRESKFPFYDSSAYKDIYTKYYMDGNDKAAMGTGMRIFNKTGTAYGFLIDLSYVVDFTNRIEFMVTAVISCNSDGIYNDDKYDYDTVGYPFFKHLGEVIYDYELKRKRKIKPDLSYLQFDYSK